MKKLFWGWCLIFFHFRFSVSLGAATHSMDLLPDFAGWLLLLSGLGVLAAESGLFQALRPFAMGMAAYTGALWLGEVVGLVPPEHWLLGTLSTAVTLYVSWALVVAIRDVEDRRGAALNGASLKRAWTLLLAASLAGVCAAPLLKLSLWDLRLAGALTVVLGVLSLVSWIWFLAALWKCAKAHEALPAWEAPSFDPEIE